MGLHRAAQPFIGSPFGIGGPGSGLAGQLALHLGQTVDREVHRDVIDALEAIGRLATGHVLKDDVIELVHENAEFVLIFKRTHELRIVKKLKLGALRIDANTSSRDRWSSGSCRCDETAPRRRARASEGERRAGSG
jgi:hypothetical protein